MDFTKDIEKLSGKLLLQVGISLDHEVNGLLAELYNGFTVCK